ncbi:MAG: anthranilate synthase component 2 [Candidatus Marivariicella framensis]|jgi:anthranilate synthase component 2|tara:strand:+ start:186 stop:749 length:564 start_codon:yes stop_codon:yes gene_type:complete
MNKVFVIDNYDSFTYNLVHYLKEFKVDVKICRNDEFEMSDLLNYKKILLSPGPGIPDEAGKLKEVIKKYANSKSILGVCLGHQAIGQVFGGNLKNLTDVYHGISSKIKIVENDSLFNGLPSEIEVGRYHSWVIDKPLPEDLIATAFDSNKQIMAIKHKIFDVKGVQFHPESILTPYGKQIINNWLKS